MNLSPRSVYRKTLKRIRFVRGIITYLLSFRPLYSRLRNKVYLAIKCGKLLPINTVSNIGLTETALFTSNEMRIPETPCYKHNSHVFFLPEETAHFPETRLHRVSHATARGKTHFLTTKDNILTHELSNIQRDMFNEELRAQLFIDTSAMRATWRNSIKTLCPLKEAAVFTDAWSHNYAHFITEVLPRIALFCSLDEHRHIPLLIDANLHQNCMEAIKNYAGESRAILTLNDNECIEISNAYYIGYLGYIPFEPRGRERRHDGLFSPEGLSSLNKFTSTSNSDKASTYKKVFLRRNSGLRNLSNAKNVEAAFVKYGFTVIEPEKMTFSEQVAIMQHAEVVAGSTGAAMANLVFCNPGTRIIILLAEHKDMPYGYWRALSAASKCELTYILGRIDGICKSFHNDYSVNISTINVALNS